MTMTDPIADFLTVIRNANAIHRRHVDSPLSKVKVGIAAVLKERGYIRDFEVADKDGKKVLRVHLKYGPNGEKVIQVIKRESRPGLRRYRRVEDIPKILNGMGLAVISTPKGILSDNKAREAKVGGEWVCSVY